MLIVYVLDEGCSTGLRQCVAVKINERANEFRISRSCMSELQWTLISSLQISLDYAVH